MVKQMEVWEAASMLGVGYEDPDEAQPGAPGEQVIPRDDMALIRARLAHAEGQGEKPQPSATNPAQMTAMMDLLQRP